jgi:hypothetical protein
MSTAETPEEVLLESLLSRYEGEGFTVVAHPSSSILPPFMGKYRPDAIALGPQKKIAIEVKREGAPAKALVGISQLFAHHPDWELRVHYLSSIPTEEVPGPTTTSIANFLQEISKLKAEKHLAAGLLVGWSTLEAIGRALLPEKLGRPQTAARLVEVLASEGLVTPDEADDLRHIARLRNAAAHGHLEGAVDAEDIDKLTTALGRLAGLLKSTQRRTSS